MAEILRRLAAAAVDGSRRSMAITKGGRNDARVVTHNVAPSPAADSASSRGDEDTRRVTDRIKMLRHVSADLETINGPPEASQRGD